MVSCPKGEVHQQLYSDWLVQMVILAFYTTAPRKTEWVGSFLKLHQAIFIGKYSIRYLKSVFCLGAPEP